MGALAESICRFAQLAVDLTQLAELEVNPLVASASGVIAVDARASLAPQKA
jgi:acetyltransferase